MFSRNALANGGLVSLELELMRINGWIACRSACVRHNPDRAFPASMLSLALNKNFP